jgi:hypothetical protein
MADEELMSVLGIYGSVLNETSDASVDATIFVFLNCILAFCTLNDEQSRKWWKFPRVDSFWDVICNQVWKNLGNDERDSQWRFNFGMKYSHFTTLVKRISPLVIKKDTSWRNAIETEKAIAMVLYRLRHGYKLQTVADKFCVGKSTVYYYTKSICKAINSLYSDYIQIPDETRAREIINAFKDITTLSPIVGAIDGSHIVLAQKPAEKYQPADYWNSFCSFTRYL